MAQVLGSLVSTTIRGNLRVECVNEFPQWLHIPLLQKFEFLNKVVSLIADLVAPLEFLLEQNG